MNNNICGIYAIGSKCKPNRIYIGSSIEIYKRWAYHLFLLRNSRHHSRKLQNHYNKYGEDDLKFDVIIECGDDILLRAEQSFINLYHPWFNISMAANSRAGVKTSEETKRKISESHTGERNPMYGKRLSENHREKISKSLKGKIPWSAGKKLSRETRIKLSINSGVVIPVINIETGILYNSLSEAAESVNHKYTWLRDRLNGRTKNNTSFRLLSDYDNDRAINAFRKNNISEDVRNKMGKNNAFAILIINIETGIFYDSIAEAAASVNKKYNTLCYWLLEGNKNRCPFRRVSDYE
jgi:group I intron endonuclease